MKHMMVRGQYRKEDGFDLTTVEVNERKFESKSIITIFAIFFVFVWHEPWEMKMIIFYSRL